MAQDQVRFRVGGKAFSTTRSTIANGGRHTYLAAMTDPLWQRPAVGFSFCEADELFIDRNPAYFRVLLELLQTGDLRIPAGMSETALFQEALYYGLLDHVRAAKCGPLNGTSMKRTAAIHASDLGPGSVTEPVIKANPDGGCCIARRSLVRVYDWMLQQQAVLNLDLADVHDMAFMETQPERVLIGTVQEGEEVPIGGIACFDVSSGEVVHRYELTVDEHLKRFGCHAVATGDSGHVFAYCINLDKNDYQNGILGTWDQNTGQQIQQYKIFVDMEPEGGWFQRGKLQWLPESKLMLVTSMTPNYGCSFGLFDLRTNQVLWPSNFCTDTLTDAVAMEDCSTLWLVSEYGDLAFTDLRARRKIHWGFFLDSSSRSSQCETRLAFGGSQLFASRYDKIHVLSNRSWQTGAISQTGMVKTAEGAEIADISVGGDRLFVLHKEAETIEVWETPRKSVTYIS